MKRWGVVFLCLSMLTACAYMPKRRQRVPQERVEEGIKSFNRGSRIIKGKDAPGKLF